MSRRTKIIATVGPASWDAGVLEQLIEAGVDVFRLNFSHADADRHAQHDRGDPRRRRAGRARGRGARRPAGAEAADRRAARRRRRAGDRNARDPDPDAQSRGTARRSRSPGRASPRCARTSSSTSPTARSGCGSREPEPDGVECEVEVGGTLSSHKGMNVPGATAGPAATDGDLGWVEFAVEHGIDLLAISFVSSAADLGAGHRAAARRSAPTSR